jgi:hypothetical protein
VKKLEIHRIAIFIYMRKGLSSVKRKSFRSHRKKPVMMKRKPVGPGD